MLDDRQMKRLNRFFPYRRSRQRVVLYLLADGFSVRDVISLDCQTLEALPLHEDMGIYVEEILAESQPADPAFSYPGGVAFKTSDIYRIIRQATALVMDKPMKIAEFSEFVRS